MTSYASADYQTSMECEVQAFLKAIHFYRQEKGHYESWDMLVGTDCQVGYSQACFEWVSRKAVFTSFEWIRWVMM